MKVVLFVSLVMMIGASRETFSRIIGDLKDEGLLSKTEDSQVDRLSSLNE